MSSWALAWTGSSCRLDRLVGRIESNWKRVDRLRGKDCGVAGAVYSASGDVQDARRRRQEWYMNKSTEQEKQVELIACRVKR